MAVGISEQGFYGFADLDLAAIRTGRVRALVLWYLARAADGSGRGVVTLDAVRRLWNVSVARIRRALAQGAGIFWSLATGRLFLACPGRVARVLGLSYLHAAYRAPLAWLLEHGKGVLRARLALNAFAVKRDRKPIAVATIARTCGVSRRTVFRWLRLTGWGKIRNVTLVHRIRDARVCRVARKYADDGSSLCTVKLGNTLWLARRLPNSLEGSERKVRRRAALRRANAILPTFDHRGRGQRQRRYIRPDRRRPNRSISHSHILSRPLYVYKRSLLRPRLQIWESPLTPLNTGDISARLMDADHD